MLPESAIHSLGSANLCDSELAVFTEDKYEWVVYWYECDCYEGSGMLFALRKDGKVDADMLGHCSCYGPLDDWPGNTQDMHETLREMIFDPDRPGKERRMPEDHDYPMWQAINIKIRELLAERNRL